MPKRLLLLKKKAAKRARVSFTDTTSPAKTYHHIQVPDLSQSSGGHSTWPNKENWESPADWASDFEGDPYGTSYDEEFEQLTPPSGRTYE